ncbi:MAG: helix-turn-helix domain-containing protein, partial [Pseudooceanicola nanhaiensis]
IATPLSCCFRIEMICSSLNRDLFIPSVSFVGTDSTSNWRRKRVSGQLFSLREKTGESLQQVADKVGVSKAHVWELEKGRSKNPSYDLVRKLAAHFGVSVDVLNGDAAEPEKADMQIERINRGLDELSDRDRGIVEQMIEAMKTKRTADT